MPDYVSVSPNRLVELDDVDDSVVPVIGDVLTFGANNKWAPGEGGGEWVDLDRTVEVDGQARRTVVSTVNEDGDAIVTLLAEQGPVGGELTHQASLSIRQNGIFLSFSHPDGGSGIQMDEEGISLSPYSPPGTIVLQDFPLTPGGSPGYVNDAWTGVKSYRVGVRGQRNDGDQAGFSMLDCPDYGSSIEIYGSLEHVGGGSSQMGIAFGFSGSPTSRMIRNISGSGADFLCTTGSLQATHAAGVNSFYMKAVVVLDASINAPTWLITDLKGLAVV